MKLFVACVRAMLQSVSLAVSVALVPVGASAASRIEAIHAHLYYHGTGKIDSRDLVPGKLALWNTVIGAGDAHEPSEATLVLVEVAVDSATSKQEALRLVAKAGSKRLLDHTVGLVDFYPSGAKLVVPFLVYGTGCEPLELTAILSGGQAADRNSSGTVPFKCGE